MIEINMNPPDRELRWFGLIVLAVLGIFGGLALWSFASLPVAIILWTLGTVLSAVFYTVVPTRRILYRAWMRLFYPLGWLVTHLLFGLIYFLVFTPTGLVMRMTRYDPLNRRATGKVNTYWSERPSDIRPGQYFNQF